MYCNLSFSKPLKVARLYLWESGVPETNKIVWINDHFLVMADDKKDSPRTWYAIDKVRLMEGVEPYERIYEMAL